MARLPIETKEVFDHEVNTRIDCNVTISSANNVTWSFNGLPLLNSFIDGMEECNTSSGIFQLRHQPTSLIICQMNQTVHMGLYTCLARSHNMSESKDMKLKILGSIILTSY